MNNLAIFSANEAQVMSDVLLEMRGITKTFPGVKALNDVNLQVRRAEIHALVGENGAGKSTQIKELVHALGLQGIEAVVLREPGGTTVAEKIRQILLESSHGITPVGELLRFSASRAELVQEVIRPALASGKTIILDRFFDSTTAYQGYGRGIDMELLRSIIAISTCGIDSFKGYEH